MALAVDPGDHVVTVVTPGQPVATFTCTWTRAAPPRRSPRTRPPGPQSPRRLRDPAPSRQRARRDRRAAHGPRRGGSRAGSWSRVRSGSASARGSSRRRRRTWSTASSAIPTCDRAPSPGRGARSRRAAWRSLSGIVLYYVNRPGRSEVSLAPAFLPGGGGAVVAGAFLSASRALRRAGAGTCVSSR